MRNLTITRTKTFVACLVKMKIYIEDHQYCELLINDTPCRKIGELKNGETKTFQIDDSAAKVFVIADKMSRNYCNEFYQLCDGTEDIFLTGKNLYNPANGNAFRFDNNETVETVKNRKRGNKKGIIILICSAIVGGIIGFVLSSGLLFNSPPQEKTFSSNGMTITLTDEFEEIERDPYDVVFDSSTFAVFALEEKFTDFEGGNITFEEYTELVLKSNGLEGTQIKINDGLHSFEYEATNSDTNETYTYFTYIYETDDSFWLVQFATLSENAEEHRSQITTWAKSVTFD